MATITSANSILMLSITGLYPVPQQIQSYQADDAFAVDAVEPAEVMMGVDGRMSAGWVPMAHKMTIALQADSASNDVFDAWMAAQEALREIYFANGIISLPAISRSYVMTRGVLTSIPKMASAKKVLNGRSFGITWESIVVAPI